MGAYSVVSIVVSCIVYALSIIGMWITFRKAGRWGWISIIPVVNTIMICLIGWRKAWPVIVEIIVGVVGVVLLFVGDVMLIFTEMGIDFSASSMLAVFIIGLILIIIAFIFYIIITNRFSKSFGHRAGFTVGLILVPWIMYLVLAFGKSEYIYEKKHQFGRNKASGGSGPSGTPEQPEQSEQPEQPEQPEQ